MVCIPTPIHVRTLRHHASQGLILSVCSNQNHYRSGGMSKFDHQFWTAADRNWILRYYTGNSAGQPAGPLPIQRRAPFRSSRLYLTVTEFFAKEKFHSAM